MADQDRLRRDPDTQLTGEAHGIRPESRRPLGLQPGTPVAGSRPGSPTSSPGLFHQIHQTIDGDHDGAVADDYLRWGVTGGAMVGGAALGAALAAPTGPGAVAGAVAGAGLGYCGGTVLGGLGNFAGDFIEDFMGTRLDERGNYSGGTPVKHQDAADLPYRRGERTWGMDAGDLAHQAVLGALVGRPGTLVPPRQDPQQLADQRASLFAGLY